MATTLNDCSWLHVSTGSLSNEIGGILCNSSALSCGTGLDADQWQQTDNAHLFRQQTPAGTLSAPYVRIGQ